MIPQSFINSLLERVDIADVVGGRVRLKKAGSNQIGLCPFHEEKTPSFHVYPDGYHCFGCGAHGTALGFLMEMDGLAFPEAVESLAAFAGVDVPREKSAQRSPSREKTEPLYDVLTAADEKFRGWLRYHAEGPEAAAYLKGRGVSGEIVRQFGIGLAPSGWEALKSALGEFGQEKLIASGLATKNEQGRVYDRFRARIVFPIRDTRGRVVGFGGRTYPGSGAKGEGPREGDAKYLNSPETPVFRKGEEVYGLFEARRSRRRIDHLLVVEGYMDVVALAGHGIGEAVATLGTAVGEAHFKRMFRVVDRVICCFDGDAAGRRAAWKAVDAAFPTLTDKRELRFVFLPEGEDPDSLVRSRGADHFRSLIKDAVPVGEYFWDHAKQGLDLKRVDHRAILCEFALPHIALLPREGALRGLLLGDLALLADADADTLASRLSTMPREQAQPAGDSAPPMPDTARPQTESKTEALLLHRLVRRPSLFGGLSAAQRESLIAARGLLGEVAEYVAEQPDADTAVLLGHFTGEPVHQRLATLAGRTLAFESADAMAAEAEFHDCLRRYLDAEDRRMRQLLIDQTRRSESLEDLKRFRDAKAKMAAPL